MSRRKLKKGSARKVLIMRLVALFCLLVVPFVAGSCLYLREGWVKVDFIEGEPSPVMLCKMELKKDDLTATCASLDAIREEMKRQEREKNGDL